MMFDKAFGALVSVFPKWARVFGRKLLIFEDRHNALHEWRRSRSGPPRLVIPVQRIIVICYGNICRSPFAAELLAKRLPDLDVRSAGLEARDGRPAEAGAKRTALRHGIDLSRHAAHRMQAVDVQWADLIIAMEGYQCARVRKRWPQGESKVHLLGDFFERGPFLTTDPYGFDDKTFERVFERIAEGVELLAHTIEVRGTK